LPIGMSFETLTVTDDHNVRTIALNRPDAMNGINVQMTGELAKALKGVAKEKSLRCLLLTGAGKAFCVGQDLKEAVGGDGPMDFAKRLRTGYNPVVQSLMSLNIPTVAAVNGAAAGAGWSLALACDFRIAANSAKFVAAFSNIGLVPDSAMLLILGRYEQILSAISIGKDYVFSFGKSGDITAFYIIIPVGIGVVISLIGVTNLLKWLLKHYERATIGFLLGIVIGSALTLLRVVAPESTQDYAIGAGALVGGFVATVLLERISGATKDVASPPSETTAAA